MIINSTPEYQMGLDEETVELENKLPETQNWEEANEVTEEPVTLVKESQSLTPEPITDTDF